MFEHHWFSLLIVVDAFSICMLNFLGFVQKISWTCMCINKRNAKLSSKLNPSSNWSQHLTLFNAFQYYRKHLINPDPKQPPRDVARKRRSKNMQQIYRRTTTPKCDFNKVALQLCWSHTLARVFSCKFATYFQNTSSWKHLWVAASVWSIFSCHTQWKHPKSMYKYAHGVQNGSIGHIWVKQGKC